MDMKTAEKIHSIGYHLKDAKTTINQDIKYEVADQKVEGKQGEVMNIPRWVGQILQEQGLGELDSPDMVTELKQALSKEKMIGEYQLATLDPHFYIKLKDSMKKLDKHDYNNVESILMELFRMRRGKIIKIADSSKLTAELNSKLSIEEKIFFQTISDNSKELEKQVMGERDE